MTYKKAAAGDGVLAALSDSPALANALVGALGGGALGTLSSFVPHIAAESPEETAIRGLLGAGSGALIGAGIPSLTGQRRNGAVSAIEDNTASDISAAMDNL